MATKAQPGFTSDYNLFHLTGTGRLANWGGLSFDRRVDWFYELGFDGHSLVTVSVPTQVAPQVSALVATGRIALVLDSAAR